VCMLIYTLVSSGMDNCMYVNMYIGIWWYGQCILIYTLLSGGMDSCMYVNVRWYLVVWTVLCMLI
jgi:hypothetical protein